MLLAADVAGAAEGADAAAQGQPTLPEPALRVTPVTPQPKPDAAAVAADLAAGVVVAAARQ
jgi:hypothetical protein